MKFKIIFLLSSVLMARTALAEIGCNPNWQYCVTSTTETLDQSRTVYIRSLKNIQITGKAKLDIDSYINPELVVTQSHQGDPVTLNIIPHDPTQALQVGVLSNSIYDDSHVTAYSELVLNPDVSMTSNYAKEDQVYNQCNSQGRIDQTTYYTTTFAFYKNAVLQHSISSSTPVTIKTNTECVQPPRRPHRPEGC